MTPKISALAITYNEECNIKRFMEQLSFADEIVLVDSYSTDKTVEIAQLMGAKVVQRSFDDFSSQRNFALTQTQNDWILFLDLDELISENFINEVKNTLQNTQNVAFFAKRTFFFMGKHIRFGGWQTDKAIRVLNKNFCTYNGNLVHETVSCKGETAVLKTSIDHFSYKDFDTYNSKLTLYSKLQAKNLYAKKVKPHAYHFFIRPLYRFLWQYIYRLGFLDGKTGFILAYVHAFSVFKRYLQLWMMYRKIE